MILTAIARIELGRDWWAGLEKVFAGSSTAFLYVSGSSRSVPNGTRHSAAHVERLRRGSMGEQLT